MYNLPGVLKHFMKVFLNSVVHLNLYVDQCFPTGGLGPHKGYGDESWEEIMKN